jgi:hypothetical protein
MDKNKLLKYIREEDPSEKKVSQILKDGYLLHSVTPFQTTLGSVLIYHFVLDESKSIEYPYPIGIDLFKEPSKINFNLEDDNNPFSDYRNEE